MPSYTTQQIAQRVGGDLAGPGYRVIQGVATLEQAGPEHLTFVREERHARRLPASGAGAVLAPRSLTLPPGDHAVIAVQNVDLAVASVLELFAPPGPTAYRGVHPTAVVDPTATLGAGVSIGAHVYVGPHTAIGAGSILYPNVTVLDHVRIGRDCRLYPGAVVGERCEIGDRCILQNNVSLGADGFNYRPSADGKGMTKIPHVGIVRLGHDVEIGACSCVDRGKFDATEIGDSTKIDNLVQVGHNCRIGRCCVIAGATAIAGSVEFGDGVMVGGAAAFRDHVKVGSGARVAGGAGVTGDVAPGTAVMGIPAREMTIALREFAAVRKLPRLLARWRGRSPNESDGT